jgi:hypothetical protein
MTDPKKPAACPDCADVAKPSRRDVLKRATGAALLGAATSAGLFDLIVRDRIASAAEAAAPAGTGAAAKTGETLVAQLFGSLKEEQRKALCFPFDHPLRSKVDNNWMIVKQSIKEVLSADQQDLVKQIFFSLHSPEYAQKVFDQVEHDGQGPGSFHANCAVAMFGQPGDEGKSKFEFVLTGRHCTRRCDGNSVDGAAFGGPIFYGHAAQGFNEKPDHPNNAYWYQALAANEVFKSLDGKQREVALRTDGRKEEGNKTIALSGKKDGLPGLAVADMSKDQRALFNKVLADLLAPFRKTDADEAMKLVEAGGVENLHLAFYKNQDLGNDGVWDVWQVEGPHMVWYFRGAPHVHTWVNIKDPKAKT